MRLRGRQIEKITLKAFSDYCDKEFPESEGWFYQQTGFPDVVLFNRKNREIVFAELKSNNHDFHNFQKQMLYFLTNAEKSRAIVVKFEVDVITGELTLSKDYPKDFKCEHSKGWRKVKDAGVLSNLE